MLKNEIYEKDEPILKQLNKIEQNIVYNDHYQQKELNFGSNEKIIEIIFHFNVNDYFHNKTLNKIFILQDDDQPAKTEASHIDWKEGKNVTKKTIKQVFWARRRALAHAIQHAGFLEKREAQTALLGLCVCFVGLSPFARLAEPGCSAG